MAKRVDLDSWQEFESQIEKIRVKNTTTRGLIKRLLYRGQSNASWRLETTLQRHQKAETRFMEYFRTISYLRGEIESFTENRWNIPEFEEIDKSISDYHFFPHSPVLYRLYGYMAHIRHHGFPSPLLDWSRSLRIAAYFAFADATPDHRVSIYVLSEAQMHSGGGGEPEIQSLGKNVRTHRRHFLQQCEYTISAAYKDKEWWFADHETAFEERDEADELPVNFSNYQFTLPGSEKFKVLEMLDQDNINAFSLFGSEESLMQTLALREFHFPDPYFGED